MFKIPVYRPSIGQREKELVNRCLDTSWISSRGEYVTQFEKNFSEFVQIPYSSTVSNGTVALHLALEALGIGAGDEVIVPTFTYVASVNAIQYTGAKPVFVDSLKDTWQMDPEDVRRKVNARTRAIMAVHLYGHPCDMETLVKIAAESRIAVVEDCAEGFGTYVGSKHVGQFGLVSTFSFFGNKTITTGEGGMVVTQDERLDKRIKKLRGQGLADREYWHDVVGYNYRMTNVCAAIGCAQLERAKVFLKRKAEIAALYDKRLRGTPVTFHGPVGNVTHSYWMCSVAVPDKNDRDALRKKLAERGIETRPTFYPVHTMPMYNQVSDQYPVAQDVAARGINLPSFPDLTDAEVEEVIAGIRSFYGK